MELRKELGKIYSEIAALLETASQEEACTKEENEVYADMANLKNSLENAGYADSHDTDYMAYFDGYQVPENMKNTAIAVMKRFAIHGLCDGMYICNRIALTAGIGDGCGHFTGDTIEEVVKPAESLHAAYGCNIRKEDLPELKVMLTALICSDKKQTKRTMVVPDNDIDPYRCPTCDHDLGFCDDDHGDITDIVEHGRVCPFCGQLLTYTETKEWKTYDFGLEYRLLARCKADCLYFLGYGNRKEKYLWGKNVKDHIQQMRDLLQIVPEEPVWLTKEDINDFERKMLSENEGDS